MRILRIASILSIVSILMSIVKIVSIVSMVITVRIMRIVRAAGTVRTLSVVSIASIVSIVRILITVRTVRPESGLPLPRVALEAVDSPSRERRSDRRLSALVELGCRSPRSGAPRPLKTCVFKTFIRSDVSLLHGCLMCGTQGRIYVESKKEIRNWAEKSA